MPKMQLTYPGLDQGGLPFEQLRGRLKHLRKMYLPRSGGSPNRRGRSSELADKLSIERYQLDLAKFSEELRKTRKSEDLAERRFAFDVAKESRAAQKDELAQAEKEIERQKEFTYKWIELVNKAGADDNKILGGKPCSPGPQRN